MTGGIVGTVTVECPACGLARDVELVQSVNTRLHAAAKARLLAGELNVLACDCGRRTQLAANLLYHDPDADYFCRVVPAGDDRAMTEAAAMFRAAAVTGTCRLVPSMNALIEKAKILDAGLEDWAIEMLKVLLLASTPERDLDRVMLFGSRDTDAALVRWVVFEPDGSPHAAASPLSAYERLAARTVSRPAHDEYRVDRAWAVEAVRRMVDAGN